MYSKRLHSHKNISIGYIEEGDTAIKVLNQKYLLIPGDLVIIPPDTSHICVPEDENKFKFLMFYFDCSWWETKIGSLTGLLKSFAVPASTDFKRLIKTIIDNSDDAGVAEENIILQLKTITDNYNVPDGDILNIEENMKEIHNQICNMPQVSKSIDELASCSGLNKFSFIRKYAQMYGLTPHADIINMRIQRAILLFESKMDLTTIALECGFSDQSHFIKQFKLYSGLTPHDYRDALLSGKQQ